MKRIIAAAALLFSVNTFAADRTLWLNDEICNIVSNTAGVIAADVVKDDTIDTFDYDVVLQLLAYRAFNDTLESGGIRRKQLVNTNVAYLYLRENQFSLHGSIKRTSVKNPGRAPAVVERIKNAVSQEFYDKCSFTVNFEMSPLTVPNPADKQAAKKGPKVQL